MKDKNRLNRIESNTLTFVSLECSHRMLDESDYQFLLQQARRYQDGVKDRELVKRILGND